MLVYCMHCKKPIYVVRVTNNKVAWYHVNSNTTQCYVQTAAEPNLES